MVNININNETHWNGGNRVLMRTAADRTYLVNRGAVSTVDSIKTMKGNQDGEPTSFANQGTNITAAGIDQVCGAIDSTGDIHIAYYFLDPAAMQADPEVRYARFSTSSDTYEVTNEQVANLDDGAGDFGFSHILGICVDINDDPHVCWCDETNDMGTPIPNYYYANKIGGSWNSRVSVEVAAENDVFTVADIMIASPTYAIGADRPILIQKHSNTPTMNAYHGTALNATGFTQASDITGAITALANLNFASLAVDSLGNMQVAYLRNNSDIDIVEHLATNAWGTWETPETVDSVNNYDTPSLAVNGTNRYIYAEDVGNNDIRLWKDEGTGWSQETGDADLPNVGTFDFVKVKWASRNNNSPRELDYAMLNTVPQGIWNTFQGGALPRQKFQARYPNTGAQI